MSETIGRACLTLAEPDAFLSTALSSPLHKSTYDGASIVVQQLGEEVECLLRRTQKSAQALREAGYRIADVALLLGNSDSVSLLNRLAVALGLSALLAGTPYTLHLISSATPDGRVPLFEFVDRLLANRNHSHDVRLIFNDQKSASGASKARPRRSHSSESRAVSGKRSEEKEEKTDTSYRSERSFGSFTRAFTLPNGIDGNKVTADLKNGVLTIQVAKKAEVLPKQVKVKAA